MGFFFKSFGGRSLVLRLSCLFTVLVGVAGTWYVRSDIYQRERKDVQIQIGRSKAASSARKWNKLHYVDSTSNDLTNVIRSQVQKQVKLSGGQQEQLSQTICGLFSYFSNPSFKEFLLYKTRGLAFSTSFSDHTWRRLQSLEGSNNLRRTNEMDVLNWAWDVLNPTNWAGERPMILKISPTTLRISASSLENGRSSASFNAVRQFGMVSSSESSGILTTNYTKHDAKRIPNGSGEALAEISFIAKVNTATNPSSFVVTYLWAGDSSQWFPLRLYAGTSADFGVSF